MADGVKYRYKGHYISPGRAASFNNLRNVSKHITTEYVYKGKSEAVREGYKPSIDKLVKKALEKSRTEKLSRPEVRQKLREQEKNQEESHLIEQVREAVKYAEREDVSLEEGFDATGFDEDDYQHYSFEDAMAYAVEDEMEFEFEMADLEDEDKYHD